MNNASDPMNDPHVCGPMCACDEPAPTCDCCGIELTSRGVCEACAVECDNEDAATCARLVFIRHVLVGGLVTKQFGPKR